MPEDKAIPKRLQQIADDMDAGINADKLVAKYGYKPDVLDKIYSYVRGGGGEGDNPVIGKVLQSLSPAKSDKAARFAEFDEGAKMMYWRSKLVEALPRPVWFHHSEGFGCNRQPSWRWLQAAAPL